MQNLLKYICIIGGILGTITAGIANYMQMEYDQAPKPIQIIPNENFKKNIELITNDIQIENKKNLNI